MRAPWKTTGVAVFGVAAVLLISMGGAILAAPVTVPLMVLVARRHPTRTFRIVGAVLVSLTAAEVIWALTYVTIGEAKPWIWLLPAACMVGALYAFALGSNPPRDQLAGT